jgi:hypothetical protein
MPTVSHGRQKRAIWKGYSVRCRKKTIGEPDAGNLHVWFDEVMQETAATYRACVLLYGSQPLSRPERTVARSASTPR